MTEIPPGPAALIRLKGASQQSIADSAGISIATVNASHTSNMWPKQRRPRLALARVLGVDGDPLAQAEPTHV